MRTQLITREGYDKLKQELDYLWREERPEVTKSDSGRQHGRQKRKRRLPVQQEAAARN